MKLIKTACLVSAVALAAPAYAQTAPAPAPAQEPAKAASDEVAMPDIIVTATRDKTLLSKTPIALTAITGDGLRSKGVTNPTALGDQVPGLSIDRTNGLQITIRGVTSTDGTEKGNPSAAFLADGVYLARPQQADVSFMDVDHVEVLKGPQGTLYGRNTTAGVINVITKRPSFDRVSVEANVGAGNYNAYNADAAFNLPVNDWAAFRLSLNYDTRDNFVKGVAGDPNYNNKFRTNISARLQGLFKLGDRGDLLLRGSYSRLTGSRDSSVPFSNFYQLGTDSSSAGNTAADKARVATWAPIGNTRQSLTTSLLSASFNTPFSYTSGGTTYTSLTTHQYGGGDQSSFKPNVHDIAYNLDGEFNYDFGGIKATYLGSIRQYEAKENSNVLSGVNLPGTFNGDYTQQSHELRLASSGDGPLKIQGGLYYFREESRIAFYIYNLLPQVFGNTFIYGFPQHTISSTKGAFTQGTYKITDAVRLTAGIRYTADDLSRYGHTVHLNTLGGQPLVGGQYTLDPAAGGGRSYVNDATVKGRKVTWRAGFDADVAGGLLYGSIATGYKVGGFGDGCSTGGAGQSLVTSQGERCDYSTVVTGTTTLKYGDQHAIYYEPETLTDYELGFRGRVAPWMKIDTNLFLYDYKNLQLSAIIPINGANQTVTTNAGKARVLGWEFETQFYPTRDLNLTLGVDLTDGHYTQFCPSGLVNGKCTANDRGQVANYAGQKLDRTPSTVLYGSINYTVPVGEGNVVASVYSRYSSAYSVTVFGDTGSYWLKLWTPSQTRTQASLTYNAPNSAWYATAFVKNIENKVALVTGSATSLTMTDPRTFGVRAGVKF
ncbi:TonB-dependent receptor [Novosphingobium sp. SG720]|uniref:TonB-dependent receptor n=1 Tax=Novosphingobium sp. SG720 TaxID=2586998 RepID=UPI001446B9EC|nr:TonB-dependent receptor [Novosphingobium sp. SG720]NKJ44287.1 iron complex outermembrane receptor protein [Novosphingobium sp. SG720]